MGSGKSSIGRRVARKLNFEFRDTDRLIVDRSGLPIAQIFRKLGEQHFRDLEREALASLPPSSRLVIATGGGIVLDPENCRRLGEIGCVGWLHAGEDITFERVSRNKRRPLLHTDNPRETVSRLLAEREPLYREASHFRIETSLRSQSQVAALVVSEYRRFCADHSPA